EVCRELGWWRGNGEPNLGKGRAFLNKLSKSGHVKLPPKRGPQAGQRRRLCARGQSLPGVGPIPRRVDQLQGLKLHLISGWEDPLSALWNEFIVQQHPL